VPGFDAAAWQAVMAPAETPRPIVAKLNSELNAIVAMVTRAPRMADLGMNPVGTGSPEETATIPAIRNRALGQSRRRGRPRRDRVTDLPVTAAPDDIDRQLPAGDEIFPRPRRPFRARRRSREPRARARRLCADPISIRSPRSAGGTRPTGTGNVTAMFSRGYMEVLFQDCRYGSHPRVRCRTRPPCRAPPRGLAVADAAKAHRRLATADFRVRDLVRMQRPVKTESGAGTASFTIARVEPEMMPEGRIQMLTHHTEGSVWQQRWLSHPNSGLGPDRRRDRGCGYRGSRAALLRVSPAARRRRHLAAHSYASTAAACTWSHTTGRRKNCRRCRSPALPFMLGYAIRVRSLAAAEARSRARRPRMARYR